MNEITWVQIRPILHQQLIKQQVVHSCLNCLEFDDETEHCTVVNVTPPAKVLVYGCPKWTPDIPF